VGRTELGIARGIVEVISVQNRYSVVDRSSEKVLQVCEQTVSASCPGGRSERANLGDEAASALDEVAAGPRRIPLPDSAPLWLTGALPGHAADPRYVKGGAPGGEHRRRPGIELTADEKAKLDAL